MTEIDSNEPHSTPLQDRWGVLVWILVGVMFGVVLMVAFIAYGQPGLLLEHLNLRYCG
ncbi:MAG: hypothetical protein AB1642_05585 [Pseudomonadota bacterium]